MGAVMPIVPAKAEPQLDLALVLAVDISSSMETEEQTLQRMGFVEAFRSSLVHEVIKNGPAGRIAVTYVEWSGAKDQTILVPWMVIDGPEKARSFADNLSGKPTRQAGMTSISAAIDFSRELFVDVGKIAARRVIDISGDGPNNDGRRVALARDETIAEGIVINGLPIMFERTMGSPEMDGLDAYYRECIIGGVGSFMIPLHDPEQFAMVIRTKIMREIAGLEETSPKVVPAQATMNCVTGERRKSEDGISENRKP
jgi:Mg-chelatase subunit ChlD